MDKKLTVFLEPEFNHLNCQCLVDPYLACVALETASGGIG